MNTKRREYNGWLITQERLIELRTLTDDRLMKRLEIAHQMCTTMDAVEREFGQMWRSHERTHWPLRYEDYFNEACRRGLL